MVVITPNIIHWFYENYTKELDDDLKNRFLELKNQVEGWKKGTHLKSSRQQPVQENQKIRENLSLYLNQLSQNNYETIKRKIHNEIDGSKEAIGIFHELVLINGLTQENNLPVLERLLFEFKYTGSIMNLLDEKQSEIKIKKIDASNYNQLCIDNKYNLIYKNSYLFIALIYVMRNIPKNIDKYVQNLVSSIENEDDKELGETYIEIFINFFQKIYKKFLREHPDQYKNILNKLESWKNDKSKFTNRARFQILDFFDLIEN